MNLSKVWLPMLMVSALSACGSSSSDNDPYEGTWVNCSPDNGTSVQITLVNDDGTYTETTRYFSDEACTTPDTTRATTEFSSTYIVGDDITTAGGLDANAMDLLVQGRRNTLLTCYDLVGVVGDNYYRGAKNAEFSCASEDARPVYLNTEQVFFRQ